MMEMDTDARLVQVSSVRSPCCMVGQASCLSRELTHQKPFKGVPRIRKLNAEMQRAQRHAEIVAVNQVAETRSGTKPLQLCPPLRRSALSALKIASPLGLDWMISNQRLLTSAATIFRTRANAAEECVRLVGSGQAGSLSCLGQRAAIQVAPDWIPATGFLHP